MRSVLGIAVALVVLIGCGRSAQSYLDKGNRLFDQGKFDEAELNYRKALQKDPKFGQAYHRLGMVELKQGKAAEAYQALSLAVQSAPQNQMAKADLASVALAAYLQDPNRPKVLYDLLTKLSNGLLANDARSYAGLTVKAYLAASEHRPEEAEAFFRRASEAKPGDQDAIAGRIEALKEENRVADAEKLGLESIAKDTHAVRLYDALFRLYAASNRSAEAEKILARKVRDNPSETSYILDLAAYYLRARKPDEMNATLQRLSGNSAAFPSGHRDAGDFYLAIGEWPRALEQYQAGAAADPKSKAIYQNRIARVLALEDKRSEAIQLLDQVTQANPEYKEAQTLRAILLASNGGAAKLSEALSEFRSLVGKSPQDMSLRYLFSKGLVENGDLAGAHAQLAEVVRKNPGFILGRLDLVDLDLRQGHSKEALQGATAVLDREPNNMRAQYLRGRACLAIGNLEQASAIFSSLSRRLPDSVDVRLQLALVDRRRRRFEEAEGVYKKILSSTPNEWRALAGLVDTYSAEGRLDKAFPLLEMELRRSSGAPAVRYLLADAAARAKRYDLAIEQYGQLAAQQPREPEPLLRVAEVLERSGDVDGAVASLQRASILHPRDARTRAMLATLLRQSHRIAEAKDQWRQALSLQPDDPRLMNNLSFILADTGDGLDEALKLARDACTKAPDNPSFFDTLAWVYLKKGMTGEAIQLFHKLTVEHAENSTFIYHFGVALYQKGDKAGARLQLSRALGLQPPQELQERIKSTLNQLN